MASFQSRNCAEVTSSWVFSRRRRSWLLAGEADEILVKPFQIGTIKELIRPRLADPRSIKRAKMESVAAMEREPETRFRIGSTLVDYNAQPTMFALN